MGFYGNQTEQNYGQNNNMQGGGNQTTFDYINHLGWAEFRTKSAMTVNFYFRHRPNKKFSLDESLKVRFNFANAIGDKVFDSFKERKITLSYDEALTLVELLSKDNIPIQTDKNGRQFVIKLYHEYTSNNQKHYTSLTIAPIPNSTNVYSFYYLDSNGQKLSVVFSKMQIKIFVRKLDNALKTMSVIAKDYM